VIVAVYFLGGIAYNRIVHHARGLKQIPNYQIWVEGFDFIKVTATATNRAGYTFGYWISGHLDRGETLTVACVYVFCCEDVKKNVLTMTPLSSLSPTRPPLACH